MINQFLGDIEKAIMKSDIGITPTNDGSCHSFSNSCFNGRTS